MYRKYGVKLNLARDSALVNAEVWINFVGETRRKKYSNILVGMLRFDHLIIQEH